MNMPNHTTSEKVLNAVQSVWEQAGFEHATLGIVPLYELISAYPIWMGEVARLTQRQAMLFLAKKTGLPSAIQLTGNETLSGFLFAQQTGAVINGCILVDSNDIIQRRRFSAAHEFGHYLLHFLPMVKDAHDEGIVATEGLVFEPGAETEADDVNISWWGKQPVLPGLELPDNVMLFTEEWQETEANQFAAELLMPADTCTQIIARYHLPPGRRHEFIANRLANELLVSREAMAWRISSLGL